MSKKNSDEKLSLLLGDAEKYIAFQLKTIDNLRDHGKTVLSTGSIIVSLFVALSTLTISNRLSLIFIISVVLVAILYTILMYKSSLASIPKTIEYPLKPNVSILLEKTKKLKKQRLDRFLEIIEENKEIIEERKKLGVEITFLLVCVIFFVLFSSLLPIF